MTFSHFQHKKKHKCKENGNKIYYKVLGQKNINFFYIFVHINWFYDFSKPIKSTSTNQAQGYIAT